jgi:hypothetical protein
MSDWLELKLAEGLSPVRAPQELWERVNRPGKRPSASHNASTGIWAWTTFASVVAATLAVTFAIPSPSLSQLAAAELANSRPADFKSADPREIEQWLRAHASIDVVIPAATRVQLTGARTLDRGGARIGEVLYRVAGRDAVLLVGRAGKLDAPSRHGAPVWKAHGEIYALAYSVSAESSLACKLCHLD